MTKHLQRPYNEAKGAQLTPPSTTIAFIYIYIHILKLNHHSYNYEVIMSTCTQSIAPFNSLSHLHIIRIPNPTQGCGSTHIICIWVTAQKSRNLCSCRTIGCHTLSSPAETGMITGEYDTFALVQYIKENYFTKQISSTKDCQANPQDIYSKIERFLHRSSLPLLTNQLKNR